jgi:hypothetical protein
MDISQALAPKSDQLDAVDLLGSPPQVFTITEVSEGNAEQPVNIRLAEFPRWWRPSKGMLRVMAHCWGKDTTKWVGQKVELYCDPEVMFGPNRVGGIRISRLTGIAKRTSVPMIISKGKGSSWNVDPLPDSAPTAPAPLTDAMIDSATDREQLKAWWREYPGQRAAIETRVAALKAADDIAAAFPEGDEQIPGGGEG